MSAQTLQRLKVLALIIGSIIILVPLAALGLKQTTQSNFCGACHMMKPEVYTWQASSHKNVECETCHIPSGPMGILKHEFRIATAAVQAVTGTYTAPIKMVNPINDKACSQCHNMNTRYVTPSGDLIIPHDVHAAQGVACSKCHVGVAHGKIANRKVTYPSDYGKWTPLLGQTLMQDKKFVRPEMEVCMNCHKVKKAPLECGACHTTSMLPANHKDPGFKTGAHGQLAGDDLRSCDSCHGYMSTQEIEGLQEKPSYAKFLDKDKPQAKAFAVDSYAKQNTFCKDCHSTRPPSHKEELFLLNHGLLSEKKPGSCQTCHDVNAKSEAAVTQVACNSCHPSRHSSGWQLRHPLVFSGKPRVNETCYTCHDQRTCSSCHPTISK